MEIKRAAYVDRLMALRGNGFVKVITGIRRCGKSYLLNVLFRKALRKAGVDDRHIVFVDLDDRRFISLRNPIQLDDYVRKAIRKDGKPTYVFIDEIQRSQRVLPEGVDLSRIAPEDRDEAWVTFYDVLNGLRAIENVDVYVTGSNSKTLSKDIATNFRDRGQQVRVWPLRFREWLAVSGLADEQKALEHYQTWGGMPEACIRGDARSRGEYLKGLFDQVYFKDIRERYGLRDDVVLSAVVDVLCSGIGSLTNPHKLGDTMNSKLKLHPSDHTLKNYLEFLEDSFLFDRAMRFDVKGKRYIDVQSKFYAVDMGLRNARLNFRDTDRSHPMENVIFNELRARGYNIDVGVVPIVERDKDGKQVRKQVEIDFVVNRGNDRIYIQSAQRMETKSKVEQEKKSLRQTKDFFKRIIVTEGYAEPVMDEEGIVHVGLIPFLLDDGVLEQDPKEVGRARNEGREAVLY